MSSSTRSGGVRSMARSALADDYLFEDAGAEVAAALTSLSTEPHP